MKIAVYAKPLSEPGVANGIITYSWTLLKNLARVDQKNEYHLFTNKPILRKIDSPRFHERLIQVPRLWVYTGLAAEFLKNHYDLYFGLKEILPLPLRRPRSVVSCLDLAIVPGQKVNWMGRMHHWVTVHYVLKNADRILAISETTKNEIIQKAGVHPDRIIVTPLSYDADLYRTANDLPRIDEVKRKIGIVGPYVLSAVSTIWHRKNIVNIIKGFHAYKKKGGQPHQLVFTGRKGDPVYYEEVLALIRDLELTKDVFITGGVPANDMASLYSGASVLLFPSLHEGFGMPILEAMACGCPVITSNLSAMPEVAGDAGILVDPLSTAEIGSALEKVLSNESFRSDLVKRGYERVKLFSWEKTAQKTLGVLESLS